MCLPVSGAAYPGTNGRSCGSFSWDSHRQCGRRYCENGRSVVSGMLGYAARHGAVSTNPVRDARPLSAGRTNGPRASTHDERIQWPEQLEADPKSVRWDLSDLSRFMMATGVRIGEALALYWEDVDLEAATVTINYTVVRAKGEGLVRKSTKTSAGERVLPLPSWAEMLRTRRDAARDDGRPDTSPVFPNSDGGLRDPSNSLRVLREARGCEGFSWVTSHVFRKTAATVLDEAGLSARVIADQLGHARPSMTQDVYLGRKVASRDTANVLEGILGKESGEFPVGNMWADLGGRLSRIPLTSGYSGPNVPQPELFGPRRGARDRHPAGRRPTPPANNRGGQPPWR
jgi:integrase